MWLTSKRPAADRTAMCSATTPPPAYSTGMSQPANGTILAPDERWRALSGVFLSGASMACSMESACRRCGTGNGTMCFRAGSRMPVASPSTDDDATERAARQQASNEQASADRDDERKQRAGPRESEHD